MTTMSVNAARPTMTDVADAAGVSLKTVSRVVNGEPGVRPETAAACTRRSRTSASAATTSRGRSGRGQRSHMLGLVIEDVVQPLLLRDLSGRRGDRPERGLPGDHRRARTRTPSASGARPRLLRAAGRRPARRARRRRPSVPPARAARRDARRLRRPAAGHDRGRRRAARQRGRRTQRASAHLLGLGHRRIAMLGDEGRIFTAARAPSRLSRRAGGRRARPSTTVAGPLGAHDADAAEAATGELLALADPPTAIFAANNRITVGALRVLGRTASGRLSSASTTSSSQSRSRCRPRWSPTTRPSSAARPPGCSCCGWPGTTGPPRRVVLPTWLIERGSGEVRS